MFNEQSLRADIIKTWGPAGAHIDVYDRLLVMAGIPCGSSAVYIDKPAWLDKNTIDEVRRLWNEKNIDNANPRVKAIQLLRDKMELNRDLMDLCKTKEILEKYCLSASS